MLSDTTFQKCQADSITTRPMSHSSHILKLGGQFTDAQGVLECSSTNKLWRNTTVKKQFHKNHRSSSLNLLSLSPPTGTVRSHQKLAKAWRYPPRGNWESTWEQSIHLCHTSVDNASIAHLSGVNWTGGLFFSYLNGCIMGGFENLWISNPPILWYKLSSLSIHTLLSPPLIPSLKVFSYTY